VVFWWTSDVTHNQIHFAAMGSANGYMALGFNNHTENDFYMTNGYAVLGIENNVTLYFLAGPDSTLVNPVASQVNIEGQNYYLIDGFIFIDFTWVLKEPVQFNMSADQYIIWALRANSGGPVLQYHDSRGYFQLNFLKPNPSYSKVVICDQGTCGNGKCYSNVLPLGACQCANSFTIASNCLETTHKFSHVFLSQDKQTIAEIFWTLDNSILSIDVKKPISAGPGTDPNQWVAIGFSNPTGDMIGTDAILYPDDSNPPTVSAYYIDQVGFVGLKKPAKVSILNITSFQAGANTFFGFSRMLGDGNNIITNPNHVYMIAVASNSLPFSAHKKHDLNSNGADVINLVNGGFQAPMFYWTPFVTHGLLMWLVWVVILPIGFLWARFVRGWPDEKSARWFEGHRSLMSTGFVILIISAGYAIAESSLHLRSVHQIMGATVVLAALYQVISAVMRPHADPENPTFQRLLFEYTHHTIGRLAILISWVTIPFGMLKVPGISMVIIYIHIVICGFWLLAYFCLEIRKYLIGRKNRGYEQVRINK